VDFRSTTLSSATLDRFVARFFRVACGTKKRKIYFAGVCAWLLRGPQRAAFGKLDPHISSESRWQ